MSNQTEGSLLLVDDDGDNVLSLSKLIKQRLPGVSIYGTTKADDARVLAEKYRPQAAIIDLHLDATQGVDAGFQLISDLQRGDGTLRVIVLTGHGSPAFGVRALALGAASFLEKPPEADHVCALVRDAIAQANLRRAYQSLASTAQHAKFYFIGRSEAATRIREQIQYAAKTTQAVLLYGETGTGKGLVARSIHEQSGRHPFVRYQPNFATADLVNSELFGHAKGSFTGATESRRGLLEEAHGGTLFLDEIDELPMEIQVTLLGVLQERVFRPVGSNREIATNFRLICATNRDPQEAITAGKLRRDLYHRLAHASIVLPPLRERRDDIAALAQHIIANLAGQHDLTVQGSTDEALAVLVSHSWPGNVRELEATLENAAYRAQFEGAVRIEPRHIALPASMGEGQTRAQSLHDQVEGYRKQVISEVLRRHGGNVLKTAQELKLDRTSLRRMLRRLDIAHD
ncbi:MAG: sigma-54 dependent transcriptional regulator [Bdellovibrionota bacterium]|nr:MAG: sigma-54 dependent transcriptional regulator [Bdellovibrionota bacterium]